MFLSNEAFGVKKNPGRYLRKASRDNYVISNIILVYSGQAHHYKVGKISILMINVTLLLIACFEAAA